VAGAVLWRIARRPHALDRLGIGARQSGGRWNRPGTAVIYTGLTIAIAALEKFVQLAGVVLTDLVLVRVELPDAFALEDPGLAGLPADWNLWPPGPGSMTFGTMWATEKRSLTLFVPSVLIPEEKNAILNPGHDQFPRVRMSIVRDFQYDPRMYRP
jgi:RES domain-containing protein